MADPTLTSWYVAALLGFGLGVCACGFWATGRIAKRYDELAQLAQRNVDLNREVSDLRHGIGNARMLLAGYERDQLRRPERLAERLGAADACLAALQPDRVDEDDADLVVPSGDPSGGGADG